MHPPGRWRAAALAAPGLAVLLVVTGCSAGDDPTVIGPSSATGTASAAPTSSASVTLPERPPTGVTLAELGFQHGPRTELTLPRGAAVTTRVDEPRAITVVLSAPAPREVADHLRQALPAAGFTVTGDDRDGATMTFSGFGWSGDFTGAGSVSAVVLRR